MSTREAVKYLRVPAYNLCFYRVNGAVVRGLMRASHVTIAGLAARMQLTQKRVREVRAHGLQGYFSVCEWVEAITGLRKCNRALAEREMQAGWAAEDFRKNVLR